MLLQLVQSVAAWVLARFHTALVRQHTVMFPGVALHVGLAGESFVADGAEPARATFG